MILENESLRRLARRLPTPWKRVVRERLFRACVRPTDVFLVGHPKSGNTWLAYMLAIILRAGDSRGEITVANLGKAVPGIYGDDLRILKHRTLPNPRVFRQEFPNYPNRYPRTLYMVRDPRSVLVSYYHHYRVTTGDLEMALDEFIERYLADGCILSWEPLVRWDKQVAEWTERAQGATTMLVTYEALHQDRRTVLKQVTKFCEIDSSDDVIAAAVQRGSFEAMRSEEEQVGAQAYLFDGGEAYRKHRGQRGWFHREGRTDGWRDELPVGAKQAIEKEFRPVMQALGYPLS